MTLLVSIIPPVSHILEYNNNLEICHSRSVMKLTPVDEVEISKKAGRISGRGFLRVKLQDKRGPRAVEDLGDVA